MGLRRLLIRQPAEAEDPLERLAELGRAERLDEATPTRTWPKAQPIAQTGAQPLSVASVAKTEPVLVPVLEKKAHVPKPLATRRPPSYVWRSQQHRGGIQDMSSRKE